jgi:predicted N-acetyltransferase YhbS
LWIYTDAEPALLPGALDPKIPGSILPGCERSATLAPIDHRVQLVDEALLGKADRESIATLLAEAFERHKALYRTRGWRTIPPTFRGLARSGANVVGQVSVFDIPTHPRRRVFGLGDLAVTPDHRRRGVARSLIEQAVEECWRRSADIILTDTAVLRQPFIELGFASVPRFALYYERDRACRWHPRWLFAARTPIPRPRLRLAEGDF